MTLFLVFLTYLLSPTYHSLFVTGSSDAVFYNPSLLHDLSNISFLYAVPYSIEGLNFYSVSIAYRNTGLGVQALTFDGIYQTSVDIGYGTQFRRNLLAGFGFELVQLSGEKVSNKIRFYAGLSTRRNTTSFGITVFNFYSSRPYDHGEISFQISKVIFKGLITRLNFLFGEGYPISPRAGVFYRISEKFSLIGGYSTQPDEYFVCVSLHHFLKLTYSVSFHTYLGLTHAMEISFPVESVHGAYLP